MKQFSVLFFLSAAVIFAANAADSPYGVCAHVSRMPEWKNAAEELAAVKSGGLEWVRTDFDWKYIQSKPEEWDYSRLDQLVRTAKEKNVNILPILGYDVKWARPVDKHLDLWREYVRRTVSRYAKEIRYWEVWNEANLVNGAEYTRLTPETYTQLLKAAYEEIKKIDPKLQVLFSGTGGVPIPFLEKALQVGAAQYFDIMNIHPYGTTEIPEKAQTQITPLFTLFEKYKVKKPFWVTEFSWPTHKPQPIEPVLEIALKKLSIDPKTVKVAVVRNHAMETLRGEMFPAYNFTVDLFPLRRDIKAEDLKTLDPAEYPVLVPSLTESFQHTYANDLLNYVRKGGILVLHCNGFPFYYTTWPDGSGSWRRSQYDSAPLLKSLHIAWLVSWRDKVPNNGQIRYAPGVTGPKIYFDGKERYLSGANLQKGDELIPILVQSKNLFSAPVVGIYKLDSDLKGAIIMSVIRTSGGVSQSVQGKFLPRAILCFLSAGAERVFWYKLLAEEQSSTALGGHFGIVHKDLSPRDSFKAYRFLTQMCPANSSRPQIQNNGNLYQASWKRPDNSSVVACWTVKKTEEFIPDFTVSEAYDHLGSKLAPAQKYSANDGIIYLIKSK